ncbi:unnamed protein product [Protopolystoma xenopodis]|uniref:Talin-1/2 VBS2 domain-containing protein n=1 Tax=Protopolystoma xenopodis TaxID=117903 RepID=A0A448X3S5_9PLAT|nr:unnamed protein product [Protopolystoma xenopodis]
MRRKAFQGDSLDTFQAAYESLQAETDTQCLVAAARRLAQATAQMISEVKTQAEAASAAGEADRQARLLAAAKQLADATSSLINAAKVGRQSFVNSHPIFIPHLSFIVYLESHLSHNFHSSKLKVESGI